MSDWSTESILSLIDDLRSKGIAYFKLGDLEVAFNPEKPALPQMPQMPFELPEEPDEEAEVSEADLFWSADQ